VLIKSYGALSTLASISLQQIAFSRSRSLHPRVSPMDSYQLLPRFKVHHGHRTRRTKRVPRRVVPGGACFILVFGIGPLDGGQTVSKIKRRRWSLKSRLPRLSGRLMRRMHFAYVCRYLDLAFTPRGSMCSCQKVDSVSGLAVDV
jgi:hypothetical protein